MALASTSRSDSRYAIAAASVLYTEGFLWDGPSCRDASLAAIEIAKANGTQVALALNDQYCVDRHRAEFLALLDGTIDIVFGNESEVCAVFDTDDLEDASRRLGEMCALVATTRSEKGSVLYVKGERIAVPGVPVDRVVDKLSHQAEKMKTVA